MNELNRKEASPLTIELTARQERVIQDAIRQGHFQSVEQALDAALSSLATYPLLPPPLSPAEGVERIRALRQGNFLPDDISIRDMIEEGRA